MSVRTEQSGFTLMETMLTVAILTLMFGLAGAGFSRIQGVLAEGAADVMVVNALSSAARHARAGTAQSARGVYFPYDETTRKMNELILFAGDSYATRDTTKDIHHTFPSRASFTTVDLSGSGAPTGDDREVVFAPLSGATEQYGSITMTVSGTELRIEISPEGGITIE